MSYPIYLPHRHVRNLPTGCKFRCAGLVLAGALLFTCRVLAQNWVLIWSDEFSQPDGSSPNASRWTMETGGGGWGNNELESYTSRTNNARVENGMLVIEAKKENYTGSDGIPRNYTSARLKTQGKSSWTYGRIEARMQIPRGQGIWPAFWMLGANIGSAGWPDCGEIDIMENIGAEPGTVHGTIHGPGYSGGNGIGGGYTLPNGGVVADGFHVFAIEWTTNIIRWYVDRHQYFSASPASLPAGKQWVYDQPQFILLNVAVGGNWPGNPDGTTIFPQRMTVDYVRVYGVTNSVDACGGNQLINPGFESGGLADWNTYGAGWNTGVANIDSAPVRSGTNSFKVFGQFNGGDNYSGCYQDRVCSPGDSFLATGWAYTSSGDRIAGSDTAWVEVSFRDSGANIIELYRSDVITSSTSPDVWLSLNVTNQINPSDHALITTVTNLVAPAGTAFVRHQILFRQQANAAGSVFFDDQILSVPGETEFLVPVAVSETGGALSLGFDTLMDYSYQVRYITNLSEPDWQVLTNIAGTGTNQLVTEMAGEGSRFYRVVRVCN